MSGRLRLFVAVPLGADLVAALADATRAWRRMPEAGGLRWTDPGAWHVTLAFIGSVDAERLPRVSAAIASAVEGATPLRCPTGGLGAFPRPGRARVLWYGVDDRGGHLARLATRLRAALRLERGRFRPHVTLARATDPEVDVRRLVAAASPPAGELRVDGVDLMRSHLGAGPARYETLGTFTLDGVAGG